MPAGADGRVYALLIGIDRYRVVRPLQGCVNDTRHAAEFLRQRLGTRLAERRLFNEDATRDAIAEAIRSHLSQAGPGDAALLWFSGHGSEQPVAPEYWHVEPTGMSQTLVCHDSRDDGVPDMTDKELSLLLDRVADRSAHVIAVLDCCHSGSGTRDFGIRTRSVPAATGIPDTSAYLPELQEFAVRSQTRAFTAPVRPSHVALSACQSHQLAAEQLIGGEPCGVFSASLLDVIQHLGPGATYRDLLLAARGRVENLRTAQTPVLYPAHRGSIADQPLFGGALILPAAMTARWSGGKWLVDAGRCHGIPDPRTGSPVLMTVTDDQSKVLRVARVEAGVSIVEPLEWDADPAVQYPVGLSQVPLPAAQVVVGGTPEDDQSACMLVADAIRTSAYLRTVHAEDPAPGLRLRVAAVRSGGREVFRVLRPDGSPVIADIEGLTADSARTVAVRMSHIARWTQIKELTNPWSGLTGAVLLEIVATHPGATTAPHDDPPIPAGPDGGITLTYRRTSNGWEPPKVFVRLRNITNRKLWCVLLNLTDRYRSHAALFPGSFIAPMGLAAAAEGLPIPVILPPDRPVEPGAESVDWCKLIIADREITPTGLELPPLGEQVTRGTGPLTTAESLGWRTHRDMTVPGKTGDWSTTIVAVTTRVPKLGEPQDNPAGATKTESTTD